MWDNQKFKEMRLGIMQPYLFPYIGYFQLINSVDKFVIFDDVNYIKKGWMNRNRILLNGQEYKFTIPLDKASQNKIINEINLTLNNNWKARFLKTIISAYKNAPMFSRVYPLIEKIIDFENRNLSTFVSNSIIQICNYLEIKTQIIITSLPYNTAYLKGQDKILEICRIEKAEVYINPSGGREIYRREEFEKQNVRLLFLDSKPVAYKQFESEFKPLLSIIDVMMFNDLEKISWYLNKYELI